MVTKLMKISSTIVAFILLLAFSFSAASATESFSPKPLPPQLSSDGNTLYNAVPVVVYRVDPDPPPQQARIPAPFNLRTLPERLPQLFPLLMWPMAAQTLGVQVVPLSRITQKPLLMPPRPLGATCCSRQCR